MSSSAAEGDLSDAFNCLLAATSKSTVEKLLNLAFASLSEPSLFPLAQVINESLTLNDSKKSLALASALCLCIQEALRVSSIETLGDFFNDRSPNIDPKLKTLIGRAVQANVATWATVATSARVSLPKLIDHSWAVHQQSASSSVSQMQVPAVLVRLKVREQASTVGELPEVKNVDLELSKQALLTMLDGFGKIRDQLNSFK